MQQQIYWSVDGPRGSKTLTVGAPGRGSLCVNEHFPIEFQMGSLQQPLQPGTLLRFGSLEFMSLDGSYDMVLLPPQRDSNNGRRLARQRRTRRRLPTVAEEEHPGLPRHPPRRRRRRRGNRGHAGGGTSSAVGPERVDNAGTPEEDDDSDFGWDFSRLSDPSAMRDFMSACDYCLSGCSNDGHSLGDEGCDPSRECFHIDQGDHDEDNHLGMPQDDNTPMPASRVDIPRELAMVPVPAGGQDTQLEQFREMQAKLDEEAGRLVQLQQNIDRSGQAEHLPEELLIGPETSSAVSLIMLGQGCPGL
jgi:hypothetical protein